MAKGQKAESAKAIETLEEAIAAIETLSNKIDEQAETISSLSNKIDEQEMQIDESFKKLKDVSKVAEMIPTAPVEKVLPKLPADSTFELEGVKYELLIPQYSVPVAQENGTSKAMIFTAEELLQKTAKGELKNAKHLKTLVEGKLHRYIVVKK